MVNRGLGHFVVFFAVLAALGPLAAPGQQAQPGGAAAARPDPAAEHNERLTALARRAGSEVGWIRDPYERLDLRRGVSTKQQPYSPPVDRKTLLAHALKRATAENRMVMIYAYRIQGPQMYRPMLLDDYMNLAVFSDPETVHLINRKFVPLRLYVDRTVGREIGVVNKQNDPLFLKTVEPALIFIAPSGEVLHIAERLRTFSTHWVRNLLRKLLAKHAAFNAPSPRVAALAKALPKRDVKAAVYYARERLLDGDDEGALETLTAATTGLDTAEQAAQSRLASLKKAEPAADKTREHRRWKFRVRRAEAQVASARTARAKCATTRAAALRLARRGDDALAVVSDWRSQQDAMLRNDLALEAGRTLLALGRWKEARATLKAVAVTSESAFLAGSACLQQWDVPEGKALFVRAVELGESPWNWRAAAVLARGDDKASLSPLMHGNAMLVYGPSHAYDGLPTTTEILRTTSAADAYDATVRAGFEYLLALQSPDGSWADGRYAYWPAPRIIPNVRVAITALASAAVLAWWDLAPERAKEALARSEQYLRDDGRTALGSEEEVYTQAYRMLYWARKAAADPSARSQAIKELERLALRAAEIQDATTGFFAHEYRNAFCTGSMLWSLHLSKSIGADVPPKTVSAGVMALLSARRPDGTFAYGGSYRGRRPGPDEKKPRKRNESFLKSSMARMPHCEGVLYANKQSDDEKLAFAFENFLHFLDRLKRVRKCDFHSDGELGGFFFWHGVFHASEAKSMLKDGALKEKVDGALLELVTSIAEIDGSFVDSHEMGKGYGTAMALLVLKNLKRDG